MENKENASECKAAPVQAYSVKVVIIMILMMMIIILYYHDKMYIQTVNPKCYHTVKNRVLP